MSMVSNTFLLFVLAVLILYYLVPAKAQWIVLLIFSYLYYVSGNARYLFYILYSTIIVYGFGLLIDHLQQKGTDQKVLKRIVSLGLFCNLGMLGIVKYSGFFADSLNSLFKWEHILSVSKDSHSKKCLLTIFIISGIFSSNTCI